MRMKRTVNCAVDNRTEAHELSIFHEKTNLKRHSASRSDGNLIALMPHFFFVSWPDLSVRKNLRIFWSCELEFENLGDIGSRQHRKSFTKRNRRLWKKTLCNVLQSTTRPNNIELTLSRHVWSDCVTVTQELVHKGSDSDCIFSGSRWRIRQTRRALSRCDEHDRAESLTHMV